jgi:hypothetical protein
VAFHRSIDGSDPIARRAEAHRIERRIARSSRLATGTLACPHCDAPVALTAARMGPADPIGCPYCGHAGAVRDFLSLGEPTRPMRVEVRLVQRPPAVRISRGR